MDDDNVSDRVGRLDRGGGARQEPVLKLRQSQDLIEAVPYLLGFHPSHSLVIVGLSAREHDSDNAGQVTVTARLDIVDVAGNAGDPSSQRRARSTATQAALSIAGSGAQRVVGIVYAAAADDAQACLRAIRYAGQACERAGLEVGEWYVPEARDGANGPPGVIAAQATYAGLVARPDRESLVALLAPAPFLERERLRPGLDRAGHARSQAIRAGRGQRFNRGSVRALFRASRALIPADDAEVVRLGSALADVTVRDACWLAIEGGRIDGEYLWRELAHRLPPPYDAAPLFLFGWLRWRAGDGALAGIAARAALASDPDYRAAALLDGALQQGLDPFRTPKLRKGA